MRSECLAHYLKCFCQLVCKIIFPAIQHFPVLQDDDIFAAPPTVVAKKRPKKAVTKDEDLFKDDTDIFADLPPSKPKEKKKTKKATESKSIFSDDVG